MEIGKKSVEGLSQKGRGRMQRDDRDGTSGLSTLMRYEDSGRNQ